MSESATAVERLAALDERVTEAREALRAAQYTASTGPRLADALRSQIRDYHADVELGRREPDPEWLERAERDLTTREARLVERTHGVAPGSTRRVDAVSEQVVEARAEALRAVENERRRFAADHLDVLRDERADADEAAAERLRAALAEVRDAHAEFDARRAWWAAVIGAAGLTERLHAPAAPMPAGLPRPGQVPSPQPARRPPLEHATDPGAWASGVGFRRAADFAGADDDRTVDVELPGSGR